MNIIVIGTGYVGLVTGTCLAEMGHSVACVDVDQNKIDNLNNGILPIYEPGLLDMVQYNTAEGRLSFTSALPMTTGDTTIYVIAVGTPPGEDGSADLRYVLSAAREIGENLCGYSVIVNKSTVPVGAGEQVRKAIEQILIARQVTHEFDVVSNPEFLKEGAAVEDFMKPDRIIIGTDIERAANLMRELYTDFNRNHDRMIIMGTRDAEMTKYVANAMLATKISFMNEVANVCDRFHVDVENIRVGIGADRRIGYDFIYPGCGYGGSCFPKDVKALIKMAEQHGFQPELLQAVENRNEVQKHYLFDKITEHFEGDLGNKRFALWGLAFKPGTDDMREAPSRILLQQLIDAGATISAFDPVAMDNARAELPQSWFDDSHLQLVDDQYAAIKNADALVLVTEWKLFRHPDFIAMKELMNHPVIFDGRNQYDLGQVESIGFDYYGVGR